MEGSIIMNFAEQLKYVRFKKKLTQKDLAEILEISPGAVYKYENELMNPGYKIIRKFESYLTENSAELSMPLLDDISEDSEQEAKGFGEDANMQISDLINSQKRTIELLESENQRLKSETRVDSMYSEVHAEIVFSFNIKLKWSITSPGIKVQYIDDGNYIPVMAKKLGYSVNEMADLLQINEMVEYKNHKIHSLRNKEEKEEMLGIIYNFMSAFKTVKMNTSLLIAEIPVKYTAKNGEKFASNVEYRVNWVKGSGTAHIRWCKD